MNGARRNQMGNTRRSRGYALIECLVYAFLTVLLFGAALAAFYRCVDSSMGLRRNAEDISNALLAGERWRSDVRAASGRVVLEQGVEDEVLLLAGSDRRIAYHFATNAVWRRAGDGNWICAVTNVKSSAMLADTRAGVNAWRWELELRPRAKHSARFRPLFTFLAVPERSAAR
jgi:hypothetical protein